jgi:YtcA family
VINIAGANFPAWLLCLLVGAVLAALCRMLLVIARIDPYVGPPTIIYSSLTVMFALIVWIIFFNRA